MLINKLKRKLENQGIGLIVLMVGLIIFAFGQMVATSSVNHSSEAVAVQVDWHDGGSLNNDEGGGIDCNGMECDPGGDGPTPTSEPVITPTPTLTPTPMYDILEAPTATPGMEEW